MYKRKRKNCYLLIFLIVLCSISVGFSALNSSLFINGIAIVNSNVLDVQIKNINVSSNSLSFPEPIINGTSITSNFVFSIKGDHYEYTLDVVNDGTVDAMIESFSITPTASDSISNNLNYVVSYENGIALAEKQLLNQNSFVRIKISVEYTGATLQADAYLTLNFEINYVPNDGNGIPVKDNGVLNIVPIIEGSVDEIGSIVTIGSEKFYVVGTEGDNLKLLSMYNLYVGGTSSKLYGDEATGMQDSSMLGNTSSSNNGVSVFSSASKKGTNYSDYKGSQVEEYVNNYKNILESDFGVEVVEARLITKDELSSFGCSWNKTCSTQHSFIYSTSYWTGTASDAEYIYGVFSDGLMDIYSYECYFFGVRPLIVIPKNSVRPPKVIPYANGDLDQIGTIVTLGTEKFYTIGTEGNNVKLLSMYNLYVGNSVNENWEVNLLDNPTGMQNENAKGYLGNSSSIGTTPFSNTTSKYSGSIVEAYVNIYKNLLESNYGITVNEARLITKEELSNSETFACVELDTCSSNYPWIYATSYWTGSTYDSESVYIVYNNSNFGYYGYCSFDNNNYYGVRPVIIISKNEIEVVPEIKPVSSGNINSIGTVVTIGTEKFYTIGTDGNNVKLLSMYNLYVGGTGSKLYGSEATGMQDSSMLGNTSSSSNGVTVFSSTSKKGANYSDYKGSQVEEYVNNYKTKLEEKYGRGIIEARLITKDELSAFGCSWNKYCSTNYPFIYSTSYWTGTASNAEYIYGVFNDGLMDIYSYGSYFYGVRPVIVISKDNF